MKMQLTLAPVLIALSVLAVPQDVKHAPTLQSCVGDINLWSSQIQNFTEPTYDQVREGLKAITMHEIEGRTKSLATFVSAYPMLGKGQDGNLSAAMTLSSYYDTEMQVRYFDFLYRHEMLNKFTEEDEAAQQ
jgi:hypothetical protein